MNNLIYKKDGIMIDGSFISLSEIIEKCNAEQVKEDKLSLLKMEWKSGRGFDGILEQIVLPIEKIDIIKKYIVGREIYFGEIAGKHSDIYGTLDEDDIEVIDDQKAIINFLKNYPSGHDYNHSFLCTFSDYASDGGYEDISEIEAKEFSNCF